jgi:hypothetical protein
LQAAETVQEDDEDTLSDDCTIFENLKYTPLKSSILRARKPTVYNLPYFIEYNARLNFTMIFGKIFIFLFFKKNFKKIIIASLFIIKAILNPFSATFHV